MTPEQINFIVKEVVAVCEAHADDGCFDADGALANSLRIVTSEKFLKLAALSPAKQEQQLKEALKPFYLLAVEVLRNASKPDTSALYGYNQAYITFGDLRKAVEVYEAALPYTEENPG